MIHTWALSARQIFIPVFLVLTLSACGLDATAGRRSNYSGSASVQHFAQVVLLGSEYGGDGLVARFEKSPRVSVMSNDGSHSALVENARSQINSALSSSSIRVLNGPRNDVSADILIYFAPMSSFDAIARQHGFTYSPGNSGFFWSFWGPNHEITESVILVATDYLAGSRLQSVVLEELTQSLGLVGDQQLVSDSIFYETSKDSGYSTRLGEWDINLIRLLYTELRPGNDSIDVDNALERAW